MSNDTKILAGRRARSVLANGASGLAAALCLASGGSAAAPTFTTFGVSNAIGTFAYAINAGGSVAGYYADPSSHYHGFVRAADGTITTFDAKASVGTYPHGINTKGAI